MIAVIGHGRSPLGKKWGAKIDACSTVIRMWDWTWQHFPDHGRKYDYGLYVLTPKGLGIFHKYNKELPTRGWLAYLGKPVSGPLPDGTILVDTTDWVSDATRLGGMGLKGQLTLTRGCVAAAWAIANGSEDVVLVGFDNVLAKTNRPIKDSFPPAYWKQYMSRFKPNTEKVYPIGQPKTATHDMEFELPFLRQLASTNKVNLHFAQEIW